MLVLNGEYCLGRFHMPGIVYDNLKFKTKKVESDLKKRLPHYNPADNIIISKIVQWCHSDGTHAF